MRLINGILIWYVLILITWVSGQECQFCGKHFKTLSKHIWRCPSKLHQQTLQLDRNHGNDRILVNTNEFNIETAERSIVNLNNDYSVITSDGTLTEYDENQQTESPESQ